MATPIKPTPVLHGKAARSFEANVRKAEQAPVSREEYESILSVCRGVKVADKSGNVYSTIRKSRPHVFAYMRACIKKSISTKAIRKLTLFAGIYKSERFTVEAAHKAFAGLGSKKQA